MAITGKLVRAEVAYSVIGDVSLSATVELVDDTLGSLAVRRIEIDDATLKATINQYVQQMLIAAPLMADVPVTVPTVPTIE